MALVRARKRRRCVKPPRGSETVRLYATPPVWLADPAVEYRKGSAI
jgi:hypothetical protein